jgi:hypothetical protein
VRAGPTPAAPLPSPKVPNPFVPSIRAGAPGSETPSSTSGSSSSPDSDALGEASGRASVTGATAGVEAAGASMLKSSSAPCESRSSSESNLPPFTAEAVGADIDEARPDGNPVAMGSSTGRSARGSKSGRETASIVLEPESGGQSSTYPAMPWPRYLGDGSQIGRTDACNVTCVTLRVLFPLT